MAKQVYQTADGKTFADEAEAVAWDERLARKAALVRALGLLHGPENRTGISLDTLAGALLDSLPEAAESIAAWGVGRKATGPEPMIDPPLPDRKR